MLGKNLYLSKITRGLNPSKIGRILEETIEDNTITFKIEGRKKLYSYSLEDYILEDSSSKKATYIIKKTSLDKEEAPKEEVKEEVKEEEAPKVNKEEIEITLENITLDNIVKVETKESILEGKVTKIGLDFIEVEGKEIKDLDIIGIEAYREEESKEEIAIEDTKDPIEDTKDPIEDNIILLEDIKLKDKVIVLTKDLKTYKGEVAFLGELTLKIKDNKKENNLLKVDILYIFKDSIDLESIDSYIKDKGIKATETKKGKKPSKKDKGNKKVSKEDKEEGIITLRDIIEEIVKEKLLILDLEFNPNNTFKDIRRKIRKKGTNTKSLRLEGYTYSFRIEDKRIIKEELLKILA